MPLARKDSIQWLPGNYYHIYNRGARQKGIFREQAYYLFVLEKMGEVLQSLEFDTHCLQSDANPLPFSDPTKW